jgi:hypothetical protein
MAKSPEHEPLPSRDADATNEEFQLAPLDDEPVAERPPARAVDEHDDTELELEPVDPQILAAAKQRAEEAVIAASQAINIDQIYRDLEHPDPQLPSELLENFRFQFQLKHLLVAMAVIALLVTVISRMSQSALVGLFMIGFMLIAYAGTAYFYLQDRRRQQEADRRRQEMYAARRAQPGYRNPLADAAATGSARGPAARKLTPEDYARAGVLVESKPTRLIDRLTVNQWLTAGCIIATLFGIMYLVGGPQNCAVMFGVLAVLGLTANVLGWEQPDVLLFVWWVALAVSIAMGMVMAVWRMISGG